MHFIKSGFGIENIKLNYKKSISETQKMSGMPRKPELLPTSPGYIYIYVRWATESKWRYYDNVGIAAWLWAPFRPRRNTTITHHHYNHFASQPVEHGLQWRACCCYASSLAQAPPSWLQQQPTMTGCCQGTWLPKLEIETCLALRSSWMYITGGKFHRKKSRKGTVSKKR